MTAVPPTHGTNPPISGAQLAHLGILVFDIHTMTSFYETVFGLRVTDHGRGRSFPRDLVFMSNSPYQHHQLVLASGREPGSPSSVFQMSFKVTSIDELRTLRSLPSNAAQATSSP